MKNVLKQLGKAVCYFLLYVVMQNLVSLFFQFIYGFKAGFEAAVTGVELDALSLSEEIITYVNSKLTDILLISGCLTILVLWLFFLIRKKNLLTETNIVKFPKKYVLILVVLGIALQVFFAFGGAFLPAEIMNDYAESVNQKFGIVSVVAVLAQVVAAPVVEEVIFRGLMLSRLRKAMPTAVAVVISSAVFGLIHGQIFWMTYAFLLGMLLAVIAIKTDSILTTIILHAVFNASGVVLSALAIEIPVVMYVILTVGGAVISLGAGYLLLKKE